MGPLLSCGWGSSPCRTWVRVLGEAEAMRAPSCPTRGLHAAPRALAFGIMGMGSSTSMPFPVEGKLLLLTPRRAETFSCSLYC